MGMQQLPSKGIDSLSRKFLIDRWSKNLDSQLRALVRRCEVAISSEAWDISCPTYRHGIRVARRHCRLFREAIKFLEFDRFIVRVCDRPIFDMESASLQVWLDQVYPQRPGEPWRAAHQKKLLLQGEQLNAILEAEILPYPAVIVSWLDRKIVYANSRICQLGGRPGDYLGLRVATYNSDQVTNRQQGILAMNPQRIKLTTFHGEPVMLWIFDTI